MTPPPATYDLTLVLDTQGDDALRAKVISDALAAIAAQGELVRHDEWGERALAYPIRRRATGEYHLLQFHVSDTALLDALNRSLHIADGVLRFRIVKLRPGSPEAPDMRGAPGAAQRRGEHGAQAEPAPAAAAAAEA